MGWQPVAGGGGGALTLIEKLVASGATANFDFASIAADFESLRIVLIGRSNASASSVPVNLRFNNDSGANYIEQRVVATSTTVTAGGATAQTEIDIGSITAANSTANKQGQIDILVAGYARTVFHKSAFGIGTHINNADLFVRMKGGDWANTSAITRVTLIPGSGSFITGSVASLYGVD